MMMMIVCVCVCKIVGCLFNLFEKKNPQRFRFYCLCPPLSAAMAAAADGGCGGASHTAQPVINFQKFCSLLQEHKHSSAHGSGRECAMLFGSTGAGKSTLLHLLAGSRFRQEAVKVADDGEFGGDIDFQLVTDQPIAGCEIGDTATSTTLLLSSYPDASTGLTFIDTPGFNNVGVDNDDVTVDAANSAGIMHAIRACSTLRLVFLISVKDELHNTKAGAIRNLFELMGKFIKANSPQSARQLFFFTSPLGY
jgi:energy-coupling factor transporter ATP-binding protein EcfA2